MVQYTIIVKNLNKTDLLSLKGRLENKLGLNIFYQDGQLTWLDCAGDLAEIYDLLKQVKVKYNCDIEVKTKKVVE